LKTQLHANGTNIEGEWEDVMAAVKFCHERLHSAGQFEVAAFEVFAFKHFHLDKWLHV
jgi:uncharacterized protein YqgV (UPF0045/DUF77 family)